MLELSKVGCKDLATISEGSNLSFLYLLLVQLLYISISDSFTVCMYNTKLIYPHLKLKLVCVPVPSPPYPLSLHYVPANQFRCNCLQQFPALPCRISSSLHSLNKDQTFLAIVWKPSLSHRAIDTKAHGHRTKPRSQPPIVHRRHITVVTHSLNLCAQYKPTHYIPDSPILSSKHTREEW